MRQPSFFIVGNPRSGTTLLRRMLSAHPRLAVAPECGFLVGLRKCFADGTRVDASAMRFFVEELLAFSKFDTWGVPRSALQEALERARPRTYAELCGAVYSAYARTVGKAGARVGDKNNWFVRRIPLLDRLVPDARFVYLVRDGRDVACSYRDLANVAGEHAPRLPTSVARIAVEWAENNRRARHTLASIPSERWVRVRYEDLVARPEEELRGVCATLGEAFDPAMLAYWSTEHSAAVEPAGFDAWKWRTNRPVDGRRAGRWARELSRRQVAEFEAFAADELRAAGYEVRRAGPPDAHVVARGAVRTVDAVLRRARSDAPIRIRARRGIEQVRRRYLFERDARFGWQKIPRRWVFIVGCYNSGTTLLHNLLAQHKSIAAMPWEGQAFTDVLPQPRRVGFPRLWALAPGLFALDETDDVSSGQRLKGQWGALLNDPARPIAIEKSPTNAARTRWLDRVFADARFVAIVRDGYAVSEGIRRKAGHPLHRCARQWAESNRRMLADLEHVRSSLLISYEELTACPSAVLARVTRFIGIDPLPGSLLTRPMQIHEANGRIQNMNSRSYKNLADGDLELIESIAGDMLDQLGYGRARAGREADPVNVGAPREPTGGL